MRQTNGKTPRSNMGVFAKSRYGVNSVAVMVGLIGSLGRNADIARLPVRHARELHADFGKVQPGDLLVEMLGQRIDLLLVFSRIIPQLDLRQHLIRERG